MQLQDLRIGDKARVTGYLPGNRAYRQQLLAMGLVKGVEFVLSKAAPLGDPIVLKVKDYLLTLRQQEASQLQIEKVSE